jgi:transcriptional regulator with XRE-family HTH domain
MADRQSTWRTRRERLGLTLREVARRSGVNPGVISRIERGWPAGPDDAAAILAVLDAAEKGAA